ncbi:uncharacterized protein LOC111302883 isoform X1 [Durio zibethinus]|uniref:Uncharacterized protein LOC111302883 isoform X1 n=1 Tax=Durio zibethinus TaxID=66656 RepID=A0A6P5ZPP1_DURZI|nr:uncharacterized protein LOC111302883 isoform X1 [Durio zibethinus]
MKMPFSDNGFDAIYAIKATCHATDAIGREKQFFIMEEPVIHIKDHRGSLLSRESSSLINTHSLHLIKAFSLMTDLILLIKEAMVTTIVQLLEWHPHLQVQVYILAPETVMVYSVKLYSVKLRIKSFKVPELFVEIPTTATVGSLKVCSIAFFSVVL